MTTYLLSFLLLLVPQDDPVSRLRELAKHGDEGGKARRILVEGLQQEVNQAFEALTKRNLGEMETHLYRAATLARPYSPQYAELLFTILFSTRAEVRREGETLVRGCWTDIRKRKDPASRIEEAKKNSLLAPTYLRELKALMDRCAEWRIQRPGNEMLEAEVARWKKLRPMNSKSPGCSACTSSNETDCAACENGIVSRACGSCLGKKKVSCLLCAGSGRVQHAGYIGKIRFQITKSYTKKVFQRYKGSLLLRTHPQTLTWTLGPCDGQGEFNLNTHSKPLNPRVPAAAPRNVQKECKDLWKDMDRHVLNGKAGLEAPQENGNWQKLKRESVKSRFMEYKNCKNGRIPCDACNGRKRVVCQGCNSRGSHLAPCTQCRGTAVRLCTTCKGVGDTAWLLNLIPEMPNLAEHLKMHAGALAAWLQKRPKNSALFIEVREAYARQQRKVDSKAVFNKDAVTIICKKCRGKKSTCTLCWGSGRIEYLEGTEPYAPYGTLLRLKSQVAKLQNLLGHPPVLGKLELPLELALGVKPPKPVPTEKQPREENPDPYEKPAPPGKKIQVAGLEDLPTDIREMIRTGDTRHEEGKVHLEKAMNPKDDAERVKESKEALRCFREAQTSYTSAFETLDDRNLESPDPLVLRARTNQQALVIARKRSF